MQGQCTVYGKRRPYCTVFGRVTYTSDQFVYILFVKFSLKTYSFLDLIYQTENYSVSVGYHHHDFSSNIKISFKDITHTPKMFFQVSFQMTS